MSPSQRIVGGALYSLTEINQLPSQPSQQKIPTGSGALDSLTTGGISPGAVWAITGTPGSGVSTFALQLALAAVSKHSVIYVNAHLPPQTVAQRLNRSPKFNQEAIGPNLRLATWMGLPAPNDDVDQWPDSEVQKSDLIIFDTVDEMWPPHAQRLHAEASITDRLRHLRDVARATNTAVILTWRKPFTIENQTDSTKYQTLKHALLDVSELTLSLDLATPDCLVQSRISPPANFKWHLDAENTRISLYTDS